MTFKQYFLFIKLTFCLNGHFSSLYLMHTPGNTIRKFLLIVLKQFSSGHGCTGFAIILEERCYWLGLVITTLTKASARGETNLCLHVGVPAISASHWFFNYGIEQHALFHCGQSSSFLHEVNLHFQTSSFACWLGRVRYWRNLLLIQKGINQIKQK